MNPWGGNAAGYGEAQNRVGNVNQGQARPGQARTVKCYNCNGTGHIAWNCTRPKQPQNSEYFKDKMLLMQAQENEVALDTKQQLFLAGGPDNAFDDDVNEQPIQDLALNVDNVFQAEDSDPITDEIGPSYDSDILFENEPMDFTKSVKAISLPQDVLSTSNRRLTELKNQVQCLMEAHLAPRKPTQVNKITSSCEICGGPHDTQYCMENPEQAFVEYASLRTNEVGDVEVHIGKLKLLNDFYVIDMKKDPKTPLLVGRGFLETANVVIDCKKAKIVVGEGITRSVFKVKDVDLGEDEAPYWTTLGKRESYKPRPSSDGIGAQTPYYARKDFLDCHLPREWEITRDAEINPFKDVLVFRRMVEFLGALPINFKGNIWESKDLIENPIN
nr:retrovirus-related Pol polyprotein from transposon TNT 1-94 [Tanacetum cinerariifolium]